VSKIGATLKDIAVCLAPFAFFVITIGKSFWFACTTETKLKISNLSGLDFEISETDCDLIAKDASMSIFVSKHGMGPGALLFKFDPVDIAPLPSITVEEPDTIAISAPWVGEIFSKSDAWENMRVKYGIGAISRSSKSEGRFAH
jgi:hypothetical protein